MRIPFLDLRAQYNSIKSEIDFVISDILNNAQFVGGDYVANFRKSFSEMMGIKHCVTCANGTDALYISLKSLGIGKGDEVITTASSWISTSETISQTGAVPVFVDIDNFYTIDPTRIEEKVSERTKAIIPVHLYGQMCDMESIMKIARKYQIRVIEDCAQSHFSSLNGRYAGLHGDIATFSFYPGKNLGAYGDAGCLVTNDDSIAEFSWMYANHGAKVKHDHQIEGINSRMDAIHAAVLSVKLPKLMSWNEKRMVIADQYMNGLKDVKEVSLPSLRRNTVHTWHVYGIRLKRRDYLKEELHHVGISTQIHYPVALPNMKAYDYLGNSSLDFPNATALSSSELSLPIFPEMTEEQVSYVINQIRRILSKIK